MVRDLYTNRISNSYTKRCKPEKLSEVMRFCKIRLFSYSVTVVIFFIYINYHECNHMLYTYYVLCFYYVIHKFNVFFTSGTMPQSARVGPFLTMSELLSTACQTVQLRQTYLEVQTCFYNFAYICYISLL